MPALPSPLTALAVLCLAGALATGAYLVALALRLRFLRDEAPATGDALPALTVVLAARDEEGAVEHAVRSLLAQDYPALAIIAVDDRSTDRTGAILDRLAGEDRRLSVVHLAELPAGWLGKTHALWVGASRAAGEFLLFTDGDVLFEPMALRRAVARAERERLDHLAVVPEIHARGALLRASVAAFSFYFALAIPPWRVRNRRRPEAIGIGAFNLVRARAYREAGGHAAFPLRPDDDLALARAMKRAGARSEVLSGLGELAVEWYPTLSALVNGLQKNIFSGFEFRTGRALFSAGAMLAGHVLPFLAPFVTPSPARWLFAASAVLLALQVGLAARGAGLPLRSGLLFPVAALIWVSIVVRGTIVPIVRGEIEWRGTRYPLEELRRAARGSSPRPPSP
jgi:hypothetical protein